MVNIPEEQRNPHREQGGDGGEAAEGPGKHHYREGSRLEAWAASEGFKWPSEICILKKWLSMENGLERIQSQNRD